MNAAVPLRRPAIFALVAVFSFLLSACLLSPGKFVSTLDLRKDGRFAFTYSGEIYLLGLSKLAQMGQAAERKFEAEPCYSDDAQTRRECTADELTRQQAEWADRQSRAAKKTTREAEQARIMFGGIDPASPRAAEELAERLRKQAGWKSVVYKGDGRYLVDFAISGRMDHDFAFPTIERFPAANPFVVLNRRVDDTVRVDAPGFAPGGAMGNLAAMTALDGKRDEVKMPELDGTFTITTDGTVLANNTDDGPNSDAGGVRLGWTVTPRSGAAPTALIRIER